MAEPLILYQSERSQPTSQTHINNALFPMPNLFRRHTTVSCFFCQSIIHPQPKNLSSFRCPHCRCSNRYDSNGEIHSEEPAMFDEALNPKSFAKHGIYISPSFSLSLKPSSSSSFSYQGSLTNRIRQRSFLSHLPDESDVACQSSR